MQSYSLTNPLPLHDHNWAMISATLSEMHTFLNCLLIGQDGASNSISHASTSWTNDQMNQVFGIEKCITTYMLVRVQQCVLAKCVEIRKKQPSINIYISVCMYVCVDACMYLNSLT